ncbi:MAG: methyltransferase domain-containing protein [Verrucomicrobia bacterium]|nr:methyltransferase domain-containing protein [Verrucomicrobiota bacterium]
MLSSPTARARFDLFLISFAVLFLELAAIRWFPAYVFSLTFFTNTVLLAAFVGMSVGCLACDGRWKMLGHLPALMGATCAAAMAVYAAVGGSWLASVDVGNQRSPELVYFGTELSGPTAAKLVVPVELLMGVFFVLIALWFVALGQILGNKLAAIENRIQSYTINIAGSLAGIVAFGVMAYWELPPAAWFAVGMACVVYFLRAAGQLTISKAALLVGVLAAIAVTGWRAKGCVFHWSPYYSIRYEPKTRDISVNDLSHQRMVDRTKAATAYAIPYLLRRDAGLPPIRDVLVIGAGTGNDVAHALAQGATRVDAVEIDPAIAQFGRRHHPNRPYDDPRVRLIIDDGRSFLRTTKQQYDLIVYALVDSLTLHSSFSSIRLENFLFTRQAFADVARRLKPGGVFAAYNFYRQGWIVARLHRMMRDRFGGEPLLLSLPPRDEIRDIEGEGTHMAMLLGGAADALDPIRQRFNRHGSFLFYNQNPNLHQTINGFTTTEADLAGKTAASNGEAVRLKPARLVETGTWKLPDDDWPFLYLREPRIPAHNWRGLALMLLLSLGLLAVFAPVRTLRGVNPHFFFLGAGFMLIETKSVTQAAQLFGSTWLVNSIVFAAILGMILVANLYVLLARPQRMAPYYAGLVLALAVNFCVPLDWFLTDIFAFRVFKSAVVMCLPILFAGVIFACSFRNSTSPELAFGANIAGAVFGGLVEYLSLVVGYQWLLVIAGALYLLSLVGLKRLAPAVISVRK